MPALRVFIYVFYYYSSAVELEITNGDTSGRSFTVQDALATLGFVFFHMKLNIVLPRSKNCLGILIEIVLNL